jgi:hypothetical protein
VRRGGRGGQREQEIGPAARRDLGDLVGESVQIVEQREGGERHVGEEVGGALPGQPAPRRAIFAPGEQRADRLAAAQRDLGSDQVGALGVDLALGGAPAALAPRHAETVAVAQQSGAEAGHGGAGDRALAQVSDQVLGTLDGVVAEDLALADPEAPAQSLRSAAGGVRQGSEERVDHEGVNKPGIM